MQKKLSYEEGSNQEYDLACPGGQRHLRPLQEIIDSFSNSS